MITGASGFIGQELVRSLLSDGHDIYALNRDKASILPQSVNQIPIGDFSELEPERIRRVFDGIDVVIHTAARVHVMSDSADDPLTEYRKVNLDATMALARQAEKAQVKRFIFISSIKVNG